MDIIEEMKPIIIKLTLLLILGIAGSTNVYAGTLLRCANCTWASMEQLANQQGPGTWDVWVPTTGALGRYKVACGVRPQGADKPGDRSFAGNGGETTQACTNQVVDYPPIPSDRVEAAAKASQVYNGTFGSMKVGVTVYQRDIPGSGYIGRVTTAHDYLTDINLRGRINSSITNNSVTNASNPLYGIVSWLFSHADAALGFTGGMEILVTIEFDDGSKVKVIVTLNHPAEYVPESATDSDGNTLPEDNSPRSQGRWRFGSEQNANRFAELVSRLGGELIGRGGFVWQTEIWDCTFDGLRLTCNRRRIAQ